MPRFRELKAIAFKEVPVGDQFWTIHGQPEYVPTRMKDLSGPYEKARIKGYTLNYSLKYEWVPKEEEDQEVDVIWRRGEGYGPVNPGDIVYIHKKEV